MDTPDFNYVKVLSGALTLLLGIVGWLVRHMMVVHDREIESLRASVQGTSDNLLKFADEAKDALSDMKIAVAAMNIDGIKEDIEKLQEQHEKMSDKIQDLQLQVKKP